MQRKLRALEKAQKTAVRTSNLADGRIRYYGQENASKTAGATRGRAYVTEYNPRTGQVRSWQECYNHSGNVNRVHPKMLDGQVLRAQHYPPTGQELASWNR